MSNLFFSKEFLTIKPQNHFLSKRHNQKAKCKTFYQLTVGDKLVLSTRFIYSTYVEKKQKQLAFYLAVKDANALVFLSC